MLVDDFHENLNQSPAISDARGIMRMGNVSDTYYCVRPEALLLSALAIRCMMVKISLVIFFQ